jgi:aspartate aminotransferase-like enzyme
MNGYIFTPGPVKMSESILALGRLQTPYFRNEEFSKILLECETYLLNIAKAPQGSRVVFLTGSGTAAMEAAVVNLLSPEDCPIVINGGVFGQRFVDICTFHEIKNIDHKIEGTNLADTRALDHYTQSRALLVNGHETSVGILYDLAAIGRFCKKHSILHIVDAISMFITDEVDMVRQNIDALIISSQKGLALPPGISMVILAPSAIGKITPGRSYYFNFLSYLADGHRGQTPFTPAVTIILQLHARLTQIVADSVEAEIRKAKKIADYFRNSIAGLSLRPFSRFMPNAMTALSPTDGRKAYAIVQDLSSRYNIIVAPNSGALRDQVFRVSHMGDMTISYVDVLIDALNDYYGVCG